MRFLDSLSEAERVALRAAGRVRRYPRAAPLFLEGEESAHVAVVATGRVKVSTLSSTGKEVVHAVYGPGELLGELSALDGQPRSATVVAMEPVEALVIATNAFSTFLEQHPRVALVLLRVVTRRLRDTDRLRAEFGHDTEARLAQRLVELAEQFGTVKGDSIEISMSLTQEELAGWVGATREAVARALRRLRERGHVTTGRMRITVRDLEALRELAL